MVIMSGACMGHQTTPMCKLIVLSCTAILALTLILIDSELLLLTGSSSGTHSGSVIRPRQLQSSSSTWVNVCYFTNWARYRKGFINTGNDVFEMGLDASLCTHVMYGFGLVQEGSSPGNYTITSFDPNADYPSGATAQTTLCPKACNDPNFKANWNDPNGVRCDWPCNPSRVMRGFEGLTVAMKARNPSIKAIVSVGGWNFNDCSASPYSTSGQGSASCQRFSDIASSETKSRAFARNVIAFCRNWGFDGLDIDWEYPVVAGHNSVTQVNGVYVSTPQDKVNYINMLAFIKDEFKKEGSTTPLLLTAAVGVGKSNVDAAYDVPAMNQHLDLINLMTYDLHGAWESQTGCNAPLYATAADTNLAGYPLSVSWAVDYWLQLGVSPSKLTVGLGMYGRGFKLANKANNGFNAAASGPSAAGTSTQEAGYISYYEVQALLLSGQATAMYDSDRQCPYAVSTAGDWYGYDNAESICAKVTFAKNRAIAGTMIWALDLDDFTGAYDAGVRYPLVRLASQAGSGCSAGAVNTLTPSSSSTTFFATAASSTPTTAMKASTASAQASTTSTRVGSTATSKATLTSTTPAKLATTKAQASATTTMSTRLTSTKAAASTPASCLQNTDCSTNAWCKDPSYATWCVSMGQAGSCPFPQCVVR